MGNTIEDHSAAIVGKRTNATGAVVSALPPITDIFEEVEKSPFLTQMYGPAAVCK